MTKNSLYYTVGDVQEMLGISRSCAYKIIRKLNEELAQNGFITIAGKIPKKFLNEHYYGMV